MKWNEKGRTMRKAHVKVLPLGAIVFVLVLLGGVFPSMAQAVSLTINFVGSGAGRVNGSPGPEIEPFNVFSHLSNPVTINYDLPPSSAVILEATPTGENADLATFAGWPVCPSPNGNKCTVVLNTNQTVTVRFDLISDNAAPMVNAGAPQTITLPNAAMLAGTVTDDGLPAVPGTVTRTWSKVSGPGTVAFANASAASTTASFSQAGTYVLKLTATDGALTSSANVTITVNPVPVQNQPPSVSAGSAQTITLPNTATLTGTVTDDGLPATPGTVSSTWSKVSGPGTVVFGNPSARSTTASFSQAGTYVLKLTATDGALTTSANVTITVNAATPQNQAPKVNAGAPQAITLPNTATLTGTVTDDGLPATPGTVSSTWSKVSGPGTVTFGNASALSTTVSFSQAGTYVLRLSATDGEFVRSSDLTITANNQSARRLSNDLNADGTADLLWRNSLNGLVVGWLMNDAAVTTTGVLGGVPSNWQIMGTGDVNADGQADVIWRNTTTGVVAVWFMNGLTHTSTSFPGSASLKYVIKGIGDVDGNGTADLIWHNSVSGGLAIWLMNGSTIAHSGFPGSAPVQWEVAGVGDVNADEKADVIWRNTTTGAVAVWFMNGLTHTSTGFPGGAPLSYVIKEIGDVDGNGTADIVWHHKLNGSVAIWIMNGPKVAFVGFPGGVPLDWQITGMGDVNADGQDDVIWQNRASGAVALWLMNGKDVMDTKFPRGTSTDWEIQ
jgi:K319-like protein